MSPSGSSGDDDVEEDAPDAAGRLDASTKQDASAPRVDAAAAQRDSASELPRDAAKTEASSSDGATVRTDAQVADAATPGLDANPGPRFPAISDYGKDGPFQPTTQANTGPSGGYTVYLPMELGKDGLKHPIVGWMSGGGTTHSSYPLLPRLASHGFVVIAANVTPGIGQEVMLGQQIIAGIDWAIAENQKAGSMYFGKLDTSKLASMGYSMGSLATFTIANDERLTTTVHISGGNMMPQRVQNLHAPAFFICGLSGGAACNILSPECDIAAVNCDTDYTMADTPVFYVNFPAGHLGILTPPFADQIGALSAAWLRWRLMNDSALDAMFVGDECMLCKQSGWKAQRKQLP